MISRRGASSISSTCPVLGISSTPTFTACISASPPISGKAALLIVGDAAHVNNPLGAFGLNGALHAAFNLGEKLAKVARGEAEDSLLDRYVRQRRGANVAFVQAQSIRNKQVLEEKDPAVRKHNLDELRAIAADPVAAQGICRPQLDDLERAARRQHRLMNPGSRRLKYFLGGLRMPGGLWPL